MKKPPYNPEDLTLLNRRKGTLAKLLINGSPDIIIDSQMKLVSKSMRKTYGWRWNKLWFWQKLAISFQVWLTRNEDY